MSKAEGSTDRATGYVSYLESTIDGTRFAAGTLQTTHEGRPLWVRYDLDAVAASVDRDRLAERPPGMWRYTELLPLADPAHRVRPPSQLRSLAASGFPPPSVTS